MHKTLTGLPLSLCPWLSLGEARRTTCQSLNGHCNVEKLTQTVGGEGVLLRRERNRETQ